jgi:hypothetical protein
MRTAFLSHTFQLDDKELIPGGEALIAGYDLRAVTRRRLAGRPLAPAIQNRINGSHALVTPMTRRDRFADHGWSMHPWLEEHLFARNRARRRIAVNEDGVGIADRCRTWSS